MHLSHAESSAQRQAFVAVAPCNGMDCSPAQCFYILCWDGTSGSGYPDHAAIVTVNSSLASGLQLHHESSEGMGGNGSPGMYACNSVCVVCLVHVSAACAGPHFRHGSIGFCCSGGGTISSDSVCRSKRNNAALCHGL